MRQVPSPRKPIVAEMRLFANTLRLSAAVAFALVPVSALGAQAFISGVVKEDSTGRLLGGVEVTIEGAIRQTHTDDKGHYVLEGPAGIHVAVFKVVGYQSVRIRLRLTRADTVQTDASMVHSTGQVLDSVVVPGRRTAPRMSTRDGFAERRAMGLGKFLDSTLLRQMESSRISELLRANTGVHMTSYQEIVGRGRGPVQLRAASPLKPGADGSFTCWVSVIYDGVTMYRTGSRTPPPDFSRDFSISSLESIEYYRGASETPMEFGGNNADCGVLVLWSRRGK